MAVLLSYALTTVADVKESLGIASSDTTKDNLITRKINQATRAIEAYCGRRFKETTYTQELYDASQINEFVLRQRPVTATTPFLLEIRDTGFNDDSWESIESDLFFTDTSSGVVRLNFNAPGKWGRYRITYSAGYTTIPEDLAEACATIAAYYTTYPAGNIAYLQQMQEGQRQLRFHQTAKSFRTLLEELGLDQIIDSYANYPVLADR